MTGSRKLHIPGVTEFWYRKTDTETNAVLNVYRPAVLVECTLNFRSLRAGLNHSEERNYTAWLPEAELAIDWDLPAVSIDDLSAIEASPQEGIRYGDGKYTASAAEIAQYRADLLDRLVRNERLRIFDNSRFGLFSAPGEPLESFLDKVAESSLAYIEPELKKLHYRFELQIEQVREAQVRRGFRGEITRRESMISRNFQLFESENRLASMFSTLAGTVFGAGEHRHQREVRPDEAELREDLDRVEQEAIEALQALYNEYLGLAGEYDTLEIGLQPDNIQVVRCALLWVPVIIPS